MTYCGGGIFDNHHDQLVKDDSSTVAFCGRYDGFFTFRHSLSTVISSFVIEIGKKKTLLLKK
jgi:hypothetical protein